ncbi:hypothetical protein FE257_005363 [Aspergillus nanangensis]|uniref:Uncharacterized protein n=1 Tax=Aspergillus nanangensis TaxID=2582783 RepID=A0AAD4CS60_ASPNN|nr:hypothetical protein FE257_005363 [Aspergillus nanangensis]
MADLQPTAFIPRRLKVTVIGAGISGIQFAHEITSTLSNVDLEIWDKNPCVGGTWYENQYPGCTCDVPSHTYQFSWNPNPNWSKLYPPASEIRKYLESTVSRNDLRRFMRFNWKCVSARWDEQSSNWTTIFRNVQSNETREVISDVLIYAVGRLNNYKIPEIEGKEQFEGQLIHTARWPASLDVKDKEVVVVGNGASAVQCVPALQPVAKRIVNISRGPTWITPHVFSEDGSIQRDCKYLELYPSSQISLLIQKYKDTSNEKASFRANQEIYHQHRIFLEQKLAAGFPGLWRGTAAQTQFTTAVKSFMQSKITDQSLQKALIPEFEAGCRRFTPGAHYLAALQQTNVIYVTGTALHLQLTKDALVTGSGDMYPCDLVVFATGFEPYEPRFPVIGPFNPPICPVNGSAIPGIERAANYMVRVINRLQTDNLRSVCVCENAQKRFNEWVQDRMAGMVWSGACNSWYKNQMGKVVVPWPGTILHYYAATEIVRWEDFDLRFEGHAFGSFGNGVTADGFVPDSFPWVVTDNKLAISENGGGIDFISRIGRPVYGVIQKIVAYFFMSGSA